MNNIGWMVIALLLGSLAVTWILLIPAIVKSLYETIIEYFYWGANRVQNASNVELKQQDKNESNSNGFNIGDEENRRKTI